MTNGIRETTKKILALVEKETGFPVYVHQDDKITKLATVKMARDNIPFHTVIYNPKLKTKPDYFICWESGFILRLFQVPREERKVISLNNSITTILHKTHSSYPSSLIDNLINGTILQLRSYPVGFRVSAWLYHDFPEIRDLQEQSIRKELEDNLPGFLKPEIKACIPEDIYNLNITMNSAYAFWASDIFKDPTIKLPYEKLHQAQKGLKLLAIYDEMPDSPLYDCELIDGWAKEFGISDWYRWKNYNSGD